MGHDKGLLFAEGSVILRIDPEAVLVDELVLGIPPVQGGKIVVLNVPVQDFLFDADEIAQNVRGPDLQADRAIVIDRGQFFGLINSKIRFDEGIFNLLGHLSLEEGDVEHVILVKDLPGNSQRFRKKSHGADAPSFPVASIVHLGGRLKDILPGDGDGTDKSCYAAAALLLGIRGEIGHPAAKLIAGK